jgi:hypothetical protein
VEPFCKIAKKYSSVPQIGSTLPKMNNILRETLPFCRHHVGMVMLERAPCTPRGVVIIRGLESNTTNKSFFLLQYKVILLLLW